jgi:hypothetical protein
MFRVRDRSPLAPSGTTSDVLKDVSALYLASVFDRDLAYYHFLCLGLQDETAGDQLGDRVPAWEAQTCRTGGADYIRRATDYLNAEPFPIMKAAGPRPLAGKDRLGATKRRSLFRTASQAKENPR